MTLLTIGFPCTSISSQNSEVKSFLDESSPTGMGFRALCNYIDYCGSDLEIILTENVRNLTHSRKLFDGECPILLQNRAMDSRGFAPAHILLSTSEYGVPQSRQRCWGIYLRKTSVKPNMPSPDRLFHNLQFQPMDCSKVFLDDNLALLREEKSSSRSSKRGSKWKKDFKKVAKQTGKALCCFTCQNLLLRQQLLPQPCPLQDAVMKNKQILEGKGIPITAREISILAVATTKLQQMGLNPYKDKFIIQVVLVLEVVACKFLCANVADSLVSDSNPRTKTTIAAPSSSRTLDGAPASFQMGDTWCPSAGPFLVGRTGNLLFCNPVHSQRQEKLRLQGIGPEDVLRFELDTLNDGQQSKLAGNARRPQLLTAS